MYLTRNVVVVVVVVLFLFFYFFIILTPPIDFKGLRNRNIPGWTVQNHFFFEITTIYIYLAKLCAIIKKSVQSVHFQLIKPTIGVRVFFAISALTI
jgi:hypothetical protein